MKYTPKYFKDNLPVSKNSKSSFLVRHFYRPISFYFSSFSYKLGLTANRVSFLGTIIAYFATIMFLLPYKQMYYIGVLLIVLWMISDCVDGNLARCVAKQPFGEFIDAVGSYTIVGILFPAVGIAAFNGCSIFMNNNPWVIIFGAFASITDTLARLYFQKYKNEKNISEQISDDEYCNFKEDKQEDIKKLNAIYERLSKEIGISGLLIPFLFISVITNSLDIFLIFYFIFYGLNYLFSFAVLIKNTRCLVK